MPPEEGQVPNPQDGTEGAEGTEAEELDLEAELTEEQYPKSALQKVRQEAARRRTEARDLKTFIDSLGGREYVERLVSATRTPEGVEQLFKEAGRARGIPDETLESILSGKSPVPGTGPKPDAEGEDDDDQPLTKKELKALEQRMKEEIARPLSQQRVADLAANGARTINETLEKLGVTDLPDKKRVMRYVGEFMPEAGSPQEFDPEVLAQAVRDGHKAYEDDIEAVTKTYLGRKREATSTPAGLGTGSNGSAPTFQLPKEPRNSKEASEALAAWVAKQDQGG